MEAKHHGKLYSFARRGFLVANISYRLAPRHPFPAALEDTVGRRIGAPTRWPCASSCAVNIFCSVLQS